MTGYLTYGAARARIDEMHRARGKVRRARPVLGARTTLTLVLIRTRDPGPIATATTLERS
jgi:hypothetical protein